MSHYVSHFLANVKKIKMSGITSREESVAPESSAPTAAERLPAEAARRSEQRRVGGAPWRGASRRGRPPGFWRWHLSCWTHPVDGSEGGETHLISFIFA